MLFHPAQATVNAQHCERRIPIDLDACRTAQSAPVEQTEWSDGFSDSSD
jgi:hypothetical protein